jgi:hypothetical protein
VLKGRVDHPRVEVVKFVLFAARRLCHLSAPFHKYGRIGTVCRISQFRRAPGQPAGGCHKRDFPPGSIGGELMRNFTALILALSKLVSALAELVRSVKD